MSKLIAFLQSQGVCWDSMLWHMNAHQVFPAVTVNEDHIPPVLTSCCDMSCIPLAARCNYPQEEGLIGIVSGELQLHQQMVHAMPLLKFGKILVEVLASNNIIIEVLQLQAPLAHIVTDSFKVMQLSIGLPLDQLGQVLELQAAPRRRGGVS